MEESKKEEHEKRAEIREKFDFSSEEAKQYIHQ